MDRHLLTRVDHSAGHLYVERARVDREDGAIVLTDENGHTSIPAAQISVLLLGPGTTITHAAIRLLGELDCLVSWVGEGEERFYATGAAERSAANLLRQARAWADPGLHLGVVHRLYAKMFSQPIAPGTPLAVLRGHEGRRVRDGYAAQASETGVRWTGRHHSGPWTNASPIDRAISSAGAALYGIVHAGIVAGGFSPALGFIHTGSTRSFVFDIADLYRMELAVPCAFRTVAASPQDVERRTREACRASFYDGRLRERIIPDLHNVLGNDSRPGDELKGWWEPPAADPPC